jgi:hypothetical protein
MEMGMRAERTVWLRGKPTRVRRLSRRWQQEDPETTALYFEYDEPQPTLWVKRWRDLPHILVQLGTRH